MNGIRKAHITMPIARVDVHTPLNGGIMIYSFSLEHAARAFVREQKLAIYKIIVQGHVLDWEGTF